MRGVGDEPTLGLEGRLQPVQHGVERIGEDTHLRARRARAGHPRLQFTGVDTRRHGGHAPQRAATLVPAIRSASSARSRDSAAASTNARVIPCWAFRTPASGSPAPMMASVCPGAPGARRCARRPHPAHCASNTRPLVCASPPPLGSPHAAAPRSHRRPACRWRRPRGGWRRARSPEAAEQQGRRRGQRLRARVAHGRLVHGLIALRRDRLQRRTDLGTSPADLRRSRIGADRPSPRR